VNGPLAQLEDLFVVSSFRRRGIGLELVQAAVMRASERAARFIGSIRTSETSMP
jgi:GNAT superfamily N-acetyltransferase